MIEAMAILWGLGVLAVLDRVVARLSDIAASLDTIAKMTLEDHR